eukprot:13785483-Heterocapsa_arctica.AAC.1
MAKPCHGGEPVAGATRSFGSRRATLRRRSRTGVAPRADETSKGVSFTQPFAASLPARARHAGQPTVNAWAVWRERRE